MASKDSEKESVWLLVAGGETLRTLGVPKKRLDSRSGELDSTVGIDIEQPLCRTVYHAFNQASVDVQEILDLIFRQSLFSNCQGR